MDRHHLHYMVTIILVLLTLGFVNGETRQKARNIRMAISNTQLDSTLVKEARALLAKLLASDISRNKADKRGLGGPLTKEDLRTVITSISDRASSMNHTIYNIREDIERLSQGTAGLDSLLGEHFVELNGEIQQLEDMADLIVLKLWTTISKLIWTGTGEGWKSCHEFDQAVKHFDPTNPITDNIATSLFSDLSCMHGIVTAFKMEVFNMTNTPELGDEADQLLVQNFATVVLRVSRIFWIEQNITRAVYRLANLLRQDSVDQASSTELSSDATRTLLTRLRGVLSGSKYHHSTNGDHIASENTEKQYANFHKRSVGANDSPLTRSVLNEMMSDLKRQVFLLKDSAAARKCSTEKLSKDNSSEALQNHIFDLEADFRYMGYWLVALLGQVCQTLDRIIQRGFEKQPSDCRRFSQFVTAMAENDKVQLTAQSLVSRLRSDSRCLQERGSQLNDIIGTTVENIEDNAADSVLVKQLSVAVMFATRLQQDAQLMTSAVEQTLEYIQQASMKDTRKYVPR